MRLRDLGPFEESEFLVEVFAPVTSRDKSAGIIALFAGNSSVLHSKAPMDAGITERRWQQMSILSTTQDTNEKLKHVLNEHNTSSGSCCSARGVGLLVASGTAPAVASAGGRASASAATES
jgi:hypothetical protein